ncbi:hypothetical protein ATI61_108524 [Archangium gephyra]|uniref:Uncharacterized protein n=1 Tax=Archangium gephyra TaxID=48 RepID=A0AAC8Q6R5_9BACT|nr:hypothetical protein [Archangium gephyra]AKJ02088.1 Hypothetical protein AA314_03714 [Archangium gephyra]REG28981.1 hypothetical protein ATI61_108524 [Archangium gephyra]
MSTQKKSALDPLRVRVRRIQFTVGLGFLALVIGTALTLSLTLRLTDRIGALPSWVIDFFLAPVLRHLWVLAVLPVLCYGAARVIELRPWATALGAAATGLCFTLAIEFTSNGIEGWLEAGGLSLLLELGVVAGGVVLSQRAVVRARADSGKQETKAQQQASARKDEYAEFLREAELAGEKIAQREATKPEGEGASVQSLPLPEQPAASAAASEETSEQKTPGEPKAPAA